MARATTRSQVTRKAAGTKQRTAREPAAKGARTGGAKSGRAPRTAATVSRKMVAPAPKLSKDELRERVDALTRANANLRAKSRALRNAVSEATDRIAELESEIGRLERQIAKAAPPRAGRGSGQRSAARARTIDPGDAVPPGVAPETPEMPSEEDQRVKEHLDEVLGPD